MSGLSDERSEIGAWNRVGIESMPRTSNDAVIPEFAIVAAAFACFLVVVSIPSPSNELLQAVQFFSVGIPVVVAGAFIPGLRGKTDREWVKSILYVLRLVCLAIGDIGCGIGIYWVFRHVSSQSARYFLATALVCWFVVWLLDVVLRRFGRKAALTAKDLEERP